MPSCLRAFGTVQANELRESRGACFVPQGCFAMFRFEGLRNTQHVPYCIASTEMKCTHLNLLPMVLVFRVKTQQCSSCKVSIGMNGVEQIQENQRLRTTVRTMPPTMPTSAVIPIRRNGFGGTYRDTLLAERVTESVGSSVGLDVAVIMTIFPACISAE